MSAMLGRAIIVWWHEMNRWVVPGSALLAGRLPAGWTLARVGDCVIVVSNIVKVEPKAEYKMAGVKWYDEGVFHRETVTGEGLSARYLSPVVPGALIYNRLFAWKASFAVVPGDLSDCFVFRGQTTKRHQLVRHQGALVRNPAAWLPWNYRQTVESLSNSPPPPTAAALES